MKPFNLEAVKRGEPFVTRDGTPARLIAYVPYLGDGERLLVHISNINKAIAFFDDGSYQEDEPDSWDLFMKPKLNYISVWRKDGRPQRFAFPVAYSQPPCRGVAMVSLTTAEALALAEELELDEVYMSPETLKHIAEPDLASAIRKLWEEVEDHL